MGSSLSDSGQETKKILCNWCKGETNHFLRARYTWFRNIDDNTSVSLADITGNLDNICKHQSSIWTCAGCDTVTFEWQLMYPNSDDDEKWEEHAGGYLATQSPAKVFKNLGPDLDRLYREVITSFEAGCMVLCTIGLRALIERVCKDKGLKEGNLEHRVNDLSKFLPSLNLIEALNEFRVVGNAAAHELQALTRDEAKMAIEVMEDLLNFLYDLDYKASQIRYSSKRAASKPVTPGSVQ